jgi:hypothetical protein
MKYARHLSESPSEFRVLDRSVGFINNTATMEETLIGHLKYQSPALLNSVLALSYPS